MSHAADPCASAVYQLQCRLRKQLEQVRSLSEELLRAFQTPEQWTYQVSPCSNHALWFAGHMAVSDNFFISVIDPSKSRPLEEFSEKFGMGSQPVSDPSAYPPAEEVLHTMRERRQTLLALLETLSDEDLARSTPPGTPEMWPDVASVIEMAIWHESMHAGQVSIARRALGNAPLMGN